MMTHDLPLASQLFSLLERDTSKKSTTILAILKEMRPILKAVEDPDPVQFLSPQEKELLQRHLGLLCATFKTSFRQVELISIGHLGDSAFAEPIRRIGDANEAIMLLRHAAIVIRGGLSSPLVDFTAEAAKQWIARVLTFHGEVENVLIGDDPLSVHLMLVFAELMDAYLRLRIAGRKTQALEYLQTLTLHSRAPFVGLKHHSLLALCE